ncbi:MAG: phage terminase large subunit family protein [Oscillospiraceae bacterium]|nr:phage terminase large subunit family protein [Oscillospiraceae bacterium]
MKAATHDLFKRIFAELQPPPDMTIAEWADKYQKLPTKTSSEPGQWRTSRVPYMREIMGAISDINTSKVVVMSAAQVAKTYALILNTIGYHIHYDPCPIIVVQPNVKPMAEAFSKEKLAPMLQTTPVLAGKVNEKSRNSGNTILHKEFPGGYVTIVGANSPVGLRSRSARVLLADEIDGYPPTAGKEGDPLLLASKRLTTFWNKKEVFISTPTVKGISRIEVEFENSTQEIWHVPCPDCGELQELEWAGVSFDKDNLNEINYICAKCGVVNSEVAWKERFTKGKFIPRFPDRKVRGFHLNSLASLLIEWQEIVEKFLLANDEKKKGNIEPLKVWTNTEMGQTWEEEGNEIEPSALYKRREKYNAEVPNEVLFLTAGVDTQDERFEIEVVGWGEEKESWGIQYKIIYGNLRQEQIWTDLHVFLNQVFTRADGTKLKISRACIDAGGHFFNEVCAFCKPRYPTVLPIRGKGGFDVPYIPRASKNNRANTPMFTLGVDTGKHTIYQSLQIEEEGANYCHFPKDKGRGYDEQYFKGLTSERMVLVYKRGKSQYVWKLKDGGFKRNEPLDCRNYALAALEISNATLKRESTEKPVANSRGRRKRGGFA